MVTLTSDGVVYILNVGGVCISALLHSLLNQTFLHLLEIENSTRIILFNVLSITRQRILFTSLLDSMISLSPFFALIITSRNLFQHVHSYVNVSDWCKKLRNDTDCLACDNQSECYIFSRIRQAGINLISWRKLRCSRFSVLVRCTRPDSLRHHWGKPEGTHWLFTVICWPAVCQIFRWFNLLHNTLPLDSHEGL